MPVETTTHSGMNVPVQPGQPTRFALGIDIGGSAIKAAPVDLSTGELCAPRRSVETPIPATPKAIAATVKTIRESFPEHAGAPVGITIPAVIRRGVVRTAANIDPSWIGTDANGLFTETLGVPVAPLNDADAAGLAEVARGAAQGVMGTVLVVTLGTGIGSALFVDGKLLLNTELGHLTIRGKDCCPWACAAAIRRERLSWEQWAARLNEYLVYAESLLWPDLVVIGGAISKDADQFVPLLDVESPIVPARMGNDAGIIGVAYEAAGLSARPLRKI